ncbi:uncharacterized protein PG998_012036 [Apiospora kogelbergensis]|uniref:uncharacterized protein n=1 Tax=Apiospora kogelbergensis TaxID=1337665 RepID=UPI003130BA74
MFRTIRVRAHLDRPFQLRAQHRRITKGSQSNPATRNVPGYVAAAGTVAAVGGLWLSNPPLDSAPSLWSRWSFRVVFESDPSRSKATRILLEDSHSVTAKNIAGVERIDGAQLASNNPCEDRFTLGLISPWQGQGGTPWLALAIFDGHAGWETAEYLQMNILKSIQHSLGQIKPPSREK